MCDLYVVTVDTRGKAASDTKGYHEHVCSKSFFTKNIVEHPDSVCYQSELARLCGLDLKIYFQNYECTTIPLPEGGLAARTEMNKAASFLTMDPETGFARYHVRGIAYVVLNDGLAPLSFRQVWGLQELASYATDVYKSDPEHEKRGKRDLIRSCNLYKQQLWGPLAIYKPRPEASSGGASVPPSVINVKPKEKSLSRRFAIRL
jgi:hypothetical protein